MTVVGKTVWRTGMVRPNFTDIDWKRKTMELKPNTGAPITSGTGRKPRENPFTADAVFSTLDNGNTHTVNTADEKECKLARSLVRNAAKDHGRSARVIMADDFRSLRFVIVEQITRLRKTATDTPAEQATPAAKPAKARK